jgi:hypothetical protein
LILEACRGVELAAGDCTRAVEEMQGAGVRVVAITHFVFKAR